MLEKQTRRHHSVTENGKFQGRIITEYIEHGVSRGMGYTDPVTPADTKDLTGWDGRSKDIIAVITDSQVLADFEVEKQEPTGVGAEKIITYDRVIDPDCRIAIRDIIRVYDNGVEVSKTYHRHWIMPGDDPTGNDVISKALAKKLHATKVVAKYKEKQKEKDEGRLYSS